MTSCECGKFRCSTCGKKYRKNWYYAHHATALSQRQNAKIRLKDRLFAILGGPRCVSCGFEDGRALQFDHINGGGTKARKQSNGHEIAYYSSHPDEAKQNLQVLCANCNWIKRHDRREN